MVGHLLAWEMHERDGSWHAWVSWVQQAGGRYVHKVVDVRAGSLQPLETPDAYSAVPRRVRGTDGLIRPWSGESGLRQLKARAHRVRDEGGRKPRGHRMLCPPSRAVRGHEHAGVHRRDLVKDARDQGLEQRPAEMESA
jgi:hypothetical protein